MLLLLFILGLISVNITQLLVAQMSVLTIFLFSGLYQRFRKLELNQEEANIRSEIAEKLITIEKQHNKESSTFFSNSRFKKKCRYIRPPENLKIKFS